MTPKIFFLTGGFFALFANVLGAFGAHALRGNLSKTAMQIYQTAVQYQFYHSLALLFLAILMLHYSNIYFRFAGIVFVAGIFLFSGSLYIHSISGIGWFGMITPFGGICFVTGWVLLLIGIAKT
ncbi:DUF423 domain-containing protein [Legionella israelensis]|uniref:DUF423 domain-containing protein n=1 Tax=Legionella israelensis TaxID=454 RepID=A0A0W0VJH1_9GAMM|nr:DUF423 domain-containing protein [Legionella israelensis]KTD20232.1 hypothetical protein Lisr_1816 [Legionella israelensis]QBS09019.1 DUF423 domain-containing protein [Legionella israelensis]SCY39863.1 Uncharacterized membrane protein YgdD, TMEM256/DUF423 family [Legionella israelensis DSM 19235]STX58724.1 Protein of uncharacterised function (DUF423) [Legionella israelensis]